MLLSLDFAPNRLKFPDFCLILAPRTLPKSALTPRTLQGEGTGGYGGGTESLDSPTSPSSGPFHFKGYFSIHL